MPAERPKRRSPRLPGYDYSQDGAYFVTICTHQRVLLFGDVLGGEMRLNAAGRIAHEEWLRTPLLRPQVRLDEFVIMPNHVHLLFTLDWEGHLDRDAPRRDVLQYVPHAPSLAMGRLNPTLIRQGVGGPLGQSTGLGHHGDRVFQSLDQPRQMVDGIQHTKGPFADDLGSLV